MVPRTLLSRFHHTTPVRWPNLLEGRKDRQAGKHASASVARTGFVATALLWGGALGLAPQTSVWITLTLIGLGSLALLLARLTRLPGQLQAVELRGLGQEDGNHAFVRGPPENRGAAAWGQQYYRCAR